MGNTCVRVDLRSLDCVVGGGGPCGRVDLFDQNRDDLDSGTMRIHVGREGLAQRSGDVLAPLAKNLFEGARIEITQDQAAGGFLDEGFGVRDRIHGLHGGIIGEAHTIQYADLGADTLKALAAGAAARDEIVRLARMRAFPQPVQRGGRNGFRVNAVVLVRCSLVDADRHRVNGSVFDRPQAAERPRHEQVQTRAQHGDRRAEALIDAPLPEIDELQSCQRPAQQRRCEDRRRDRGPQEFQRPAPRKVQSEMSAQQRARRPRPTRNDGGENAVRCGPCRRWRRWRQKHARECAHGQFERHEPRNADQHPFRPAQPDQACASAELDRTGSNQKQRRKQQQPPQCGCFRKLRRREGIHDALGHQ